MKVNCQSVEFSGILDNKRLLSRNYLFNFEAKFSPTAIRISARLDNSTDWKSAFTQRILTIQPAERNAIVGLG